MKKIENITIVGAGYVGMSLAILLSNICDVLIFDIDKKKVEKINKKKVPIKEFKDIDVTNNLKATHKKGQAYKNKDVVIIAIPTDFIESDNSFDTKSVEIVIDDILKVNKDCLIVIKSTIPIGFTNYLQKKFNTKNIIFSPEFLRENSAVEDNQYPSRIIVGNESNSSSIFLDLLTRISCKKDNTTFLMSSIEAESVKLFSNTFLAMRVAYFNELDSFALDKNLNSKIIIDGICSDSRIGNHYNNPSFGYGGYCLPKDTKQLLSNYQYTPQTLISAIIESNSTRKKFISELILKFQPASIGFYRLIMKEGSNNFRSSAVIDILNHIKSKGITINIYEPILNEKNNSHFRDEPYKFFNDLEKFKNHSSFIIANRYSSSLDDVIEKVFTRDLSKINSFDI